MSGASRALVTPGPEGLPALQVVHKKGELLMVVGEVTVYDRGEVRLLLDGVKCTGSFVDGRGATRVSVRHWVPEAVADVEVAVSMEVDGGYSDPLLRVI